LRSAADADVVFVPEDPDARDDAAAYPADRDRAWTVAHNVVHATASGEEYAAAAAGLARGIEYHGRPRYETPWQRVTTVAACRQRLEESRRIRLASLRMWPDRPDLDKGYTPWKRSGWVNAQGIFAWGLAHDQSHRAQIAKILRQVRNLQMASAGEVTAAGCQRSPQRANPSTLHIEHGQCGPGLSIPHPPTRMSDGCGKATNL
jgi:hypothetical protein